MENLHNDRSFIEVEKVKNASEGAGQLMASIGKEIDEHDIVGKVGNAYSFSQKAGAIAVVLFAVAVVAFLIIFGIRSMNFIENKTSFNYKIFENNNN